MAKDLYAVLGLEKSASEKDIRTAYRKLAKELHPDLNPGNAAAEDRFKDVAAAYSIIGNEEKRRKYDAGEIDDTGAERPQHHYYRHHADSADRHQYSSSQHGFDGYDDLGDIFGGAFRQARGGGARTQYQDIDWPGSDVRYHMSIDFLEAANGAKKRVTMPDGKTLDISIPAGLEDGQTLRLKGQGEPGLNKGPPGDALVSIEVRPHRLFERDGNDVMIEVPIGIHEAVLGGKIEVPTLTGRVTMTVPKGAKTGQTLRLRNKGIQSKAKSGDQMVRLKVVMPEIIDDDLAEKMKSWAETNSYNPRKTWERAG